MLNYIWGLMIIVGIIVGLFKGNISEVSNTSLDSAKEAVSLCITMLGVTAMWTGLMQIAKKCGLIESLTKLLSPVLRFLYPDIPKGHIVNEYLASNMIANILGLGWAATPTGLMAMREFKKLNNNSNVASCNMCTLLIVNISSLQLISVNIIAYRSQYGSANPMEILAPGLVATIFSTLVGVVFARIARELSKCKK